MKKTLSFVILAALAALALGGCGSSSDGEDSKATSTPKPGADQVSAGPASAEAQK